MADINVFSDLNMKSAAFRLHSYAGFPTNPKPGELSVVDGALFCYTQLEGSLQWLPLTNKREFHTHKQETPSQTWIVEHNLGTTDFIYAVYDLNNMLQFATAIPLTLDSIQVELTQPMTGKCVVIGASNKFAGYQSCSDTQSLTQTITYGTEAPTGNEDSVLYFQVGV